MLLDQYGAADVVVPTVYLERRWPGGPVVAHFVATHGPDGEEIARFTLSVASDEALDKLLDDGVRQIDDAYAQALRDGRLHTDSSLAIEAPPALDLAPAVETGAGEGGASLVVQVDTIDAAALSQAQSRLLRSARRADVDRQPGDRRHVELAGQLFGRFGDAALPARPARLAA